METEEAHDVQADDVPVESYDEDFPVGTHDGEEEEVVQEEAVHDEPEDHEDVVSRSESPKDEPTADLPREVDGADEEDGVHVDDVPTSQDGPPSEHEETPSKSAPRPVGDDLEDLVNMLEAVPNIHRPTTETSTSSAPRAASDAGEIPDEY